MGKIHKRTDGKTERLCSMEKVIFSCKNASFSVDKAQKVYYNNLRDESKWWGEVCPKLLSTSGSEALRFDGAACEVIKTGHLQQLPHKG